MLCYAKVFALSGRHCAAYVFQSDTLRFALPLSETTSYITPPLRTKFGERAFSFLRPSVMELSPH